MQHKRQPVSKNGKFFNHSSEKPHAVWLPSFWVYLKSLIGRWFNPYKPLETDKVILSGDPAQVEITWLGHATFLITSPLYNILTDPVFSDLTVFFRRTAAAPLKPQELPKIDYILISHNHRDHLDKWSMQQLAKLFPHVQVLVPIGDGALVRSFGFTKVIELQWWQAVTDALLQIDLVPTQHWSGRCLRDRNRSLWGGYVIKLGNRQIYFGGDSGYGKHFKEVAQHYDSIDVALLPVGPCSPRSMMEYVHLDAHDAVQAFLDLRAHVLVPMHWGTYHFGLDKPTTAIELLTSAWDEALHRLGKRTLQILKMGQTLRLPLEYSLTTGSALQRSPRV